MKKCENCGIEGVDFELHHVVPLSRGGTDSLSNLKTLCVSCHGKVHNVEFQSKTGLVSNAIRKYKLEQDLMRLWLIDNEEELYNFFLGFFKEYETTVLTEMFYLDAFNVRQFYHWLQTGKNYRRSTYGKIPSMVRELYLKGGYKFSIVEGLNDKEEING